MSTTNEALVWEQSFRILRGDPDYWGATIRQADSVTEAIKANGMRPISVATTHVAFGHETPHLEKYEVVPDDISVGELGDRNAVLTEIADSMPHLNTNRLRETAGIVAEVCEQIVAEDVPTSFLVAPIGMFAVLASQGGMMANSYIAKGMIERMAKHSVFAASAHVDLDELDFRSQYDLQAEHDMDLPSFDEWYAHRVKVISSIPPQERAKQLAAGTLTNVLFPEQIMHPVFNTVLFR